MTTTLRFPRDIFRLLYWIYFKPFTLRRYVKRLDKGLDERLHLWEVRDRISKKRELKELDRLVWALLVIGPVATAGLLGLLLEVTQGDLASLFARNIGGRSFAWAVLLAFSYSAGAGLDLWLCRMGRFHPELLKRLSYIPMAVAMVSIIRLNPPTRDFVFGLAWAMWWGMRFRTLSVADGLMLGVVWSTVGGIVLGMLDNLEWATRGGLAWGIAGGMAIGVGSSMTLNVGVGTRLRWLLRLIRLIVMNGFVLSMMFGVAWGVSSGITVGIAGSLVFALSWSIACILGFLTGFYRLLSYFIELPLQVMLSWLAERHPQYASLYFRYSPVQWDETTKLPLIGLQEHLVIIGKQEVKEKVQEVIMLVTGSVGQGWAAQEALVELTALEMEHVTDTCALAGVAERMAWLPAELPKAVESLLPPIRQIAQRAQATLESDTLVNRFEQLQRAQAELNNLRQGLGIGGAARYAARFAGPLANWQEILNREMEALHASIKALPIPPEYVVGAPLITESKVFKGRRDLFVILERELTGAMESRPSLLLHGARRSGKTSVLKQMPVRLGPDYVPVEIDLQSGITASGPAGLLGYIANRIVDNAVNFRRVRLPALKPAALDADPYMAFLEWLSMVEKQMGNKLILLNLDEYERLEEMVKDERLDRRVFHWLRGMIQHHPNVVVLLSGSHTLDELAPVWSDTLINVRTLRVGPLEEKEARELITAPVPDFPLKYEPEAVERILAASGRQPYLIQATCCDLVDKLNEEQRLYAGVADVERAFESCLQTAQAYFVELWKSADTDDIQRRVMLALAQAGGTLPETELARKVGGASLTQALRRLERRDIIEKTDGGYRFRADLVRRWVLQNADGA